MNITLQRYLHGSDSSLGLLFLEDSFVCFTCEDEHRDEKVAGETRIPAGRYRIDMRADSPMAGRYAKRFDFHRGMLWLRDVPNFTYVYIHVGNTDDDTEGCILVGMNALQTHGGGMVQRSVDAYSQLYPVIAEAIEMDEQVFITIEDC